MLAPNKLSSQKGSHHIVTNIKKVDSSNLRSNVHSEDKKIPDCSKYLRDVRQTKGEDPCDKDVTVLDCSKSHQSGKDTSNSTAHDNVPTKEDSEALSKNDDTKDCSSSSLASSAKDEILLKNTEDTNTCLRLSQNLKSQTENSWAFEIRNTMRIHKTKLPPHLLFVVDETSNVIFLIDSGCEISLLPKSLTNGIDHYFRPQSKTITGIRNSLIHPVGSVDVSLKLGDID